MQRKAFALFLLSTLSIGFLALESLHYKTIYGVIKFSSMPEPNQLSGKFSHPEKSYELLFNCRLNDESHDVSLTDVYKNIIIKYLHTSSEVTYIQLGQYHFIAHNKTGKIHNLPNPDLIPNEHEHHEKHLDLYRQIEKLGKSNISFQHVIKEAGKKNILVEELSKGMGEVFGRLGSEFPCVMRLHLISRALINSISTPFDEVEDTGDGKDEKHLVKRGTCSNQRIRNCAEKPKGTRCIGLCGKKDSCWKWVCGSCCYYKGCAEHDNCCYKLGYFSFKCLFPWGFSCRGYNPSC